MTYTDSDIWRKQLCMSTHSTWGIGITHKFPYKESLSSEIPAVLRQRVLYQQGPTVDATHHILMTTHWEIFTANWERNSRRNFLMLPPNRSIQITISLIILISLRMVSNWFALKEKVLFKITLLPTRILSSFEWIMKDWNLGKRAISPTSSIPRF